MGKGSGKRAARVAQRVTFREHVEQLTPQLDRALFDRARRASWLAKGLGGTQRDAAYRIKHRALSQLIDHGGATTELDWYAQPGLVAVGLASDFGDHRQRLHTRSAWLRDSVELRA